MAQPLQIIVTGDSETDYFRLREENLASIVGKIPDGCKVSIVSVVGAFRTGKSFLLNFFLRYLRCKTVDETSSWMVAEGDELSEGNHNANDGWNVIDPELSKKEMSFAWRGGQERQTTGIWMWSEPFIRQTKETGGEDLAVLLMDTQGMFDNETTMTLTAQIFGLSTLVSSFQIYNVDKRIQEDNLQHLALFSEYGRMALSGKSVPEPLQPQDTINSSVGAATADGADGEADESNTSTTTTAAAAVAAGIETEMVEALLAESETQQASKDSTADVEEKKPFQHLQFLVRDWQNFDTDYEEGQDDSVVAKLQAEMDAYLAEVLRSRGLGDLQSTREQITRCFETLNCFMLPHPGFAVTKKNYDGSISKIDPFFRALVNRYVRYVFDERLQAKEINGRRLTGKELQTYFEVYVKMFQAGQKSFPKAMTMLDATAEANNRNAYDLALKEYKQGMDQLVGTEKPYVKEVDLQQVHDALYIAAFTQFDEMATMGAANVIATMRDALKSAVESERERYFATNSLRNPFKDVELYILPMGIAVVAWIAAVLVNATCSTDFCESTEDTFVNIYLFVIFSIIVLTWNHIKGALSYAREILPLILNTQGGGGPAADGSAASTTGGAASALLESLANRAAQAAQKKQN